MTNRARGEVSLSIEGEPHTLCVTLGALAEIEHALALPSLLDLGARLKTPTIGDLAVVLAALLRGGGHDMKDEALLARQVDLVAASAAIAEAFAAVGLATRA